MISKGNTTAIGKYFIWSCAGIVFVWMLAVGFPDEVSALLVVIVSAGIALALFRRFVDEGNRDFITTLFLGALAARLAFGLMIHVYDLRSFFGGDSATYDFFGGIIYDHWLGLVDASDSTYVITTNTARAGWGMYYFVAGVYFVTGRSLLAAQSLCAVVGAATAPMVYFCAKKVFLNTSVARTAAIAVAFFPSFIIWSAQLLKDGLIIFLLVLAITMVLQLHEKVDYPAIMVLILSMFGIISLRFYIFYMVAIAVAGSFVLGVSDKHGSLFRRAALLIVIGLGLTYLGVIRNASVDFERYGDLEKVQISRADLARSAQSGFGAEADVSTAEGAISTIPIGFAYLMLAPFPWQISNVRQAIPLPEVLLWWAMIPFMISGIVYAVKHRLRTTFPILFFSFVLTLAYSIFQGNVGTAYRQRTQIQVFLFIFIAVGWELWREKRNDRKMERMLKQRKFDERLEAGAIDVIR
jgi:hypothetical protein